MKKKINISILVGVLFFITIILFENYTNCKLSLILKKTMSLSKLIQYFENNKKINNIYYENIKKLKEMEDVNEIKIIFKQYNIDLNNNIIVSKELLESLKQFIIYKDKLVAKHYRYRIIFSNIKGLLIFCVFVLILLKLVLKKK